MSTFMKRAGNKEKASDDILKELLGSVPDAGMSLYEYKAGRLADRYGVSESMGGVADAGERDRADKR